MECYKVTLSIFIEAEDSSDAIAQVMELSVSDLDIDLLRSV